jgi:hypothetical protein
MDFHIQIVKTLSFINDGFTSSVENKNSVVAYYTITHKDTSIIFLFLGFHNFLLIMNFKYDQFYKYSLSKRVM